MGNQPTTVGMNIQLLGGFSVCVNGRIIPEADWHSRRARNLIKLLAITPGHRCHRDQIIDILWPVSDLDQSVNNFHQSLHTARKILEPYGSACLVLEEGYLVLRCPGNLGLSIDAEIFEKAADLIKPGQVNGPQVFQNALSLYSGDLLPYDLYEDWTCARREALSQIYLNLLFGLAAEYESRQDYSSGIEAYHRIVDKDALQEDAHAGLMRLFALSGKRPQALRQYQTLQEILRKELEIEPSEGIKQLYRKIQSNELRAVSSKSVIKNGFPLQLTSFVGREVEIEGIKRLVEVQNARLVTITGPGGTGKTRLALRVGEELDGAFPDGIWFIEFAPVVDPELVAATAARVMGLRENEQTTNAAALIEFLKTKCALVILDNCEHLVEAVAELVGSLLLNCGQLVILATSREALRVAGEYQYRCPSMQLPGISENGQFDWETTAGSDAVRLFSARAVLADPGFLLNKDNFRYVAEICRRLDGIPLAIELAAARLHLLSPDQIAMRLDHIFRLLPGGSKVGLPRQQTLRSTMDWSYNLLSPKERLLLQRLSIFAGGWTIEAAEAVCFDRDQVEAFEVLDLLGQLVSKSLVSTESAGSAKRYRMLEIIRQYGYDRLVETGDNQRMRDHHLEYFSSLVRQAEPYMRKNGMQEWLSRLDEELHNLRLAMEWAEMGRIDLGLEIAAGLMWFWHIHSRRIEGIEHLEKLFSIEEQMHDPDYDSPERIYLRAKATLVLSFLEKESSPRQASAKSRAIAARARELFLGVPVPDIKQVTICDYLRASSREDYEACLKIFREQDDAFNAGECLNELWKYAMGARNLIEARVLQEENLAIRRELGDLDGEGGALLQLGDTLFLMGDVEKTSEYWQAAIRLFQTVGNHEYALIVRSQMIEIDILKGNDEKALVELKEMLTLGRETNSPFITSFALYFLMMATWNMKDFDQAERWCDESVSGPYGRSLNNVNYFRGRTALSRGQYERAISCLSDIKKFGSRCRFLAMQAMGILAAVRGQNRRAVVLWGVVARLQGNFKLKPLEQREYDQALASARAAMSEEEFRTAWEEGWAMSENDAIEFTRQETLAL